MCALLGMDAPPASREENFAGWTRFLESLAAEAPAVLVFDDLQWADEALLAFLDHFAAHASEVPLLVLACSRPELWEAHPAFAAGARFDRLSLRPLSREEAASLVATLLGDRDTGVRADIVSRCGGNPFFAEQSVRFVADVGQVSTLPGSVQAVVAARIDALPVVDKAIVGDAAVVGAVFWDGALAEVSGRDPSEVERTIRDLVARQLFRHVGIPTTNLRGVHEFAFVHALARDVAYRQLPRAVRARKHLATARWLEGQAGDHPLDLAETLAHHYSTARELADATGEHAMAKQLRGPAVRYLKLAGDRVFTLDMGAAGRYYEAALKLAPTGDPIAAQLELGLGEALLWSGWGESAAEHLARAAASLKEAGELRSAAVAMVRLARARQSISTDAREVDDIYRAATSLLEEDAPSAELLSVLTEWGRRLCVRDQRSAGLDTLERVVALSRDLGGPEPALALCLRGAVRASKGDPRFLDDYRRAMSAAQDQGLSIDRARVWLNFAYDIGLTEGPRRSLEEYERALSFATQRGLTSLVHYAHAIRVEPLVFAGRWDDALSEMDELESLVASAAGAGDVLVDGRRIVLLPLLWLGREGEARRRLERIQAENASAAGVGEASATAVSNAIAEAWLRSSALGAAPGCTVSIPATESSEWLSFLIPEAMRLARRGGDAELSELLCRRVGGSLPAGRIALECADALRAEARGDDEAAALGFAAVAGNWREFGVPYEEGHALLGRARCLYRTGRAAEAVVALGAAREVFARLGARPALEETDRLSARLRGAGTG
jgi:tetratricopeptide (TPR) repeat protein